MIIDKSAKICLNYIHMIKKLFFIISFLGILLMACNFDEPILDIKIGNLKQQIDLWDKQNIDNYQLDIRLFDYTGPPIEVSLVIQNGYLVNPDPLWSPDIYPSTIPDFFSFIEQNVERIKIESNTTSNTNYRFHVFYDEELHYPVLIIDTASKTKPKNADGNSSSLRWEISIYPMN